MRDVTPFCFTPAHQPFADVVVRFQLRPFDLRTSYTVQRSIGLGDGVPTFDGLAAAFQHCVIAWENVRSDGVPLEYAASAKSRIVEGADDQNWLRWLAEIAGESFRRSLLSEVEKKTS